MHEAALTEDELEELLLGANATADLLARIVRRLLRACLRNDPRQADEIWRELGLLAQLLAPGDSGLDLKAAGRAAAEALLVPGPKDPRDALARAAARYLLERSSPDPLAQARSERAWDRFAHGLHRLESHPRRAAP